MSPEASDESLIEQIGRLGPPPAPSPADQPPSGVWERVAARIDQVESPTVRPDLRVDELWPVADSGAVVSLDARRRRYRWLGAVAAALVLVAAMGGLLVNRLGDDEPEPVAAQLDPLEGVRTDPGSAVLERSGDELFIRVEAQAQPRNGEFLELWLVDTGVTDPISLGRFEGSGTYAVPDGLDPATHPVVDISTEPDDGDPTHSGVSLLRGVLDL